MIENELKLMLNRDEYDRILGRYPWDKSITQINAYYSDKNGEIRESGMTVRVR